ncbi:MAG: 50S ribosomal protein L29 [Candidatus Melainabacteria bacterium]|jgi:large subunit ribosomal protein L29|nr:50S ribosomal protein L29 [Candidatus Melainabacteria bacterium]
MILKSKDIRDKTTVELQEELVKLRKELFESKMSFHSRKLENTSTINQLKKSIARILTIITEKEGAPIAS